ncbi:protein translocase subunit SecD [Candidatus Daviesbacteria bacterium]|nr:protein translocase subunit SecD [Candidatus Daviesbacteria bacterium]
MKPRFVLWLIVILSLFALYFDLPKLPFNLIVPQIKFSNFKFPPGKTDLSDLTGNFPLKLGLDLQGGTQLVLEAQMDKINADQRDDALDSSREVIERRVNLFGVSEAVVQTSKVGNQRRILVDLPGVKDASEAASLVGKTAQLDFREQPPKFSDEATQSALLQIFEYTRTGLTGADLKKSSVVFNQAQGGTGAQVSIEFTSEGAKKFQEITKRNVGKPLAIFLDDQPISLNPPIVQQEIIGGNAVITGNFTTEEAKNLSIQLNAGALPVPIKILEQRSVGASLGQESVERSILAGVIGLLTVIVFMVAYYGWWGLIADAALLIYSLFVLAIFKTGLFLIPPVTLTLAGVAGFILSIGMAVDANILIFERMKEEKRWGKSAFQALESGFNRAWSSIRDSNVSSLITASILYFMGTGLVRGFALTLAIGVIVSMFTAIVVTKTFLRLMTRK